LHIIHEGREKRVEGLDVKTPSSPNIHPHPVSGTGQALFVPLPSREGEIGKDGILRGTIYP
jgi:hypothetical protein